MANLHAKWHATFFINFVPCNLLHLPDVGDPQTAELRALPHISVSCSLPVHLSYVSELVTLTCTSSIVLPFVRDNDVGCRVSGEPSQGLGNVGFGAQGGP